MSDTAPIRVNVYVAPKLLQATRVLAKRRGHTLSDVFRTALRQYVVAELRQEMADETLLTRTPAAPETPANASPDTHPAE